MQSSYCVYENLEQSNNHFFYQKKKKKKKKRMESIFVKDNFTLF